MRSFEYYPYLAKGFASSKGSLKALRKCSLSYRSNPQSFQMLGAATDRHKMPENLKEP